MDLNLRCRFEKRKRNRQKTSEDPGEPQGGRGRPGKAEVTSWGRQWLRGLVSGQGPLASLCPDAKFQSLRKKTRKVTAELRSREK